MSPPTPPDLDRPPLQGGRSLALANLASALAVLGVAVFVYLIAPHNQSQLGSLVAFGPWHFSGRQFLLTAAASYGGALALHALWSPLARRQAGKSLRTLCVLWAALRTPRRVLSQALAPADRTAVLATVLKMFFAPLMVMSLMLFCTAALHNGTQLMLLDAPAAGFAQAFNRHGYWFAMQTILFVDVLLFTLGYLIESPRLGNEIRSVDPTLLGWGAALLCYPPFNQMAGFVLGAQVSDFPQFDDPTAHLLLNFLLLALMAGYASASVALGWKASNLTHRGIVRRGPYALVRHPAYVCKNLAWWIGSVPLVSVAFANSWFLGAQALASVAGWTLLYVLRAVTEEDHLRSVDGDYDVYAAQVRRRFIPGVI